MVGDIKNKKEFKEKLKLSGKSQIEMAQDLGVSRQTITFWNKSGTYPKYLDCYFENTKLKGKIITLKDKITNAINCLRMKDDE